jgi:uncharacterized membrane protein YphA (DoxX/SURF4 family)
MTTRQRKVTSGALWTAQILLAALFLFAGAMKFLMPIEKMQQPVALPAAFIYFIAVAEIAGALGLILPGLLRIRGELTPVAAVGLVAIMSGAATLTAETMGVPAAIFPLVVGIVAGVVAYTRRYVLPVTA